MNAMSQTGRGWLGTLAHLTMAIITLAALSLIIGLGLGQPARDAPLHGELILDRALSTLALLPAVVVLGLLTVVPYRRFRAAAASVQLAYFHVGEAILAASVVCAAIWLVGPDTLKALF